MTLETRVIDGWNQFLTFAKKHCSPTAFENWLEPIKAVEEEGQLVLLIPNIFVKEYLLSNFRKDLSRFLPDFDPASIEVFRVETPKRKQKQVEAPPANTNTRFLPKLNKNYQFDNFIEGPSNQFVKSAALGIAARPGQSYNPLFIHGDVGHGKTHLLHSIGHDIVKTHRKLRVQCITTEAFINELVDSLRAKSVDRLKRFYRDEIDVLLVDDIQFLQNRTNFEEEFCHLFEALIHQRKQIVISSDKPPSQLNLSERIIARMEWGLVAQIGKPDLETRVAILHHKAEEKGLTIPHGVAFFIAEHIHHNVRQLEGAVNRLSAHARLLDLHVTEEMVEKTLHDMLQQSPSEKITVEQILKSVATIFQVRVADLKGVSRTKEVAVPRQVAMYLAKEMISESLMMLGASFGKTHSTILHAHKAITSKLTKDEQLKRQVGMVKNSIANAA